MLRQQNWGFFWEENINCPPHVYSMRCACIRQRASYVHSPLPFSQLLYEEWACYGVFYKYQPIDLVRQVGTPRAGRDGQASLCISTALSVQSVGPCSNLKSLCRGAEVSQQRLAAWPRLRSSSVFRFIAGLALICHVHCLPLNS